MRKRNKRFIVILSIGLVLALGACASKKSNESTPPAAGNTAATTADAEAVYKQNCIGCHAADLSGATGPNLQKVGSRQTAEQIQAKITSGGSGMPAFGSSLSSDEISALSNWLAEHK